MGFQRFLLTLWEWEGSIGGDDGLWAVVFEREAMVSKARIGVREWVREERQRGIGRRWEWDRELERKEETQEKVALGMGNAIAACFSVLDTAERFWNKLYVCQFVFPLFFFLFFFYVLIFRIALLFLLLKKNLTFVFFFFFIFHLFKVLLIYIYIYIYIKPKPLKFP